MLQLLVVEVVVGLEVVVELVLVVLIVMMLLMMAVVVLKMQMRVASHIVKALLFLQFLNNLPPSLHHDHLPF